MFVSLSRTLWKNALEFEDFLIFSMIYRILIISLCFSFLWQLYNSLFSFFMDVVILVLSLINIFTNLQKTSLISRQEKMRENLLIAKFRQFLAVQKMRQKLQEAAGGKFAARVMNIICTGWPRRIQRSSWDAMSPVRQGIISIIKLIQNYQKS